MKRFISAFLASLTVLLLLLPCCALAASREAQYGGVARSQIKALSDDDLLLLMEAVTEEAESRGLLGLSSGGGKAVPSTDLVWIPKSGKKYHKTSTCSNMKNPSQVSLDEAHRLGYTRCSKCKPPQ